MRQNLICSYNTIKTSIQGGNSKKPLGPSMHMFAAADAGVLTLLMTNPIWVVKTRLCLQYAEDVNMAESKRYRGMIDALKKIYKTEGIRGLYKARANVLLIKPSQLNLKQNESYYGL